MSHADFVSYKYTAIYKHFHFKNTDLCEKPGRILKSYLITFMKVWCIV